MEGKKGNSLEARARYSILSPVAALGDAGGSSSKRGDSLYVDIGGSVPKSCKVHFVTGHKKVSNHIIPAPVSSLCGYSEFSEPPLMAGVNRLSRRLPDPDQPRSDDDSRGRLSGFSSESRASRSFFVNVWG
jgi:hypothetical protein